MSVITYSGMAGVRSSEWGQQRNDISFNSVFGSQASEVSAPVWTVTLEGIPGREADSGEWKTLVIGLRGKTNQLAMWDLARPVPLGTMRGNMTLNTSANQGDTSLSIVASGQTGKTLLKGDWLGIGSLLTQQVVMVQADATSDGSGVISVQVEPFLRNAFDSGEAITWDKPKALFRRVDSKASWKNAASLADGFVLDLMEDWRP